MEDASQKGIERQSVEDQAAEGSERGGGAVAARKPEHPITVLRGELERLAPEIKQVLPDHITPERFNRVTLTAIQKKPELLKADRRSLFESCLACANDGLLPDGKDATFTVYRTKKQDGTWQDKVQYIAMIAGIRKKVHQSGLFASWKANIIYENDDYEIVLGVDEAIKHKPLLRGDRGRPVAVYSVAKYKDGSEPSLDWMTIAEVHHIRDRSKSPDRGPWKTDEDEMTKKTMLRRHSKALPLSPELERIVQRDDVLYDLNLSAPPRRESLPSPRAETFADLGALPPPRARFEMPPSASTTHTAEVEADEPEPDAPSPSGSGDLTQDAFHHGMIDFERGVPERSPPKEYRGSEARLSAWKKGFNEAKQRRQSGPGPFEE